MLRRTLSEYDFFTFNTVNDSGNITVTAYMGPSLNALGPDRPLAVALQVDSGEPQVTYFPNGAPGAEPPQWDTLDGWAADNLIFVPGSFVAPPGAHTLKVRALELDCIGS